MERKEFICIGCPLGCPLKVEINGGQAAVSGNTCRRGEEYGKKEATHPSRIVTSTVAVAGGKRSVVSVKTREDIPKEKIFDVIKALKEVQVQAPVSIGDVVLADAAGTGTDIIATKNVF